jgi:quercetin dioxygenase-like cupin family protein
MLPYSGERRLPVNQRRGTVYAVTTRQDSNNLEVERLDSEQVRVKHVSQVHSDQVDVAGADGVKIQWLVGKQDKPDNFFMRLFELESGGHTPHHSHPWEHEVFVLAGKGSVTTPQGVWALEPDSIVYVPANEEHQFRNEGTETLRFICLVPTAADY